MDAVLFDLDGTLIDTVPIYYEIIDIVFAELGVPAVSRATLQEAMDDGEFDWDLVLPESMRSRTVEITQKARGIIDKISAPMFQRQVKLTLEVRCSYSVSSKAENRDFKIKVT